mgnify:FL=1
MNSLQRNCLVAGSTGLIGNLLIEQLVESDNKVTALSRYELSSSNNLLTFKKIDFENEESFKEIFTGINDAFICLGTTIKKAGSQENFRKVDVDYCLSLAKAASMAKVPNLSIVTSIGADSSSNNFYLKCKGEIEDKISKLDFKSLSIFRPGLLIGARKEKRLGESVGQFLQPWLIDPFLRGSANKYRSVKGIELASTMMEYSGKQQGRKFYYFEDLIRN